MEGDEDASLRCGVRWGRVGLASGLRLKLGFSLVRTRPGPVSVARETGSVFGGVRP